MKKIFVLLLAMIMCLSVVACKEEAPPTAKIEFYDVTLYAPTTYVLNDDISTDTMHYYDYNENGNVEKRLLLSHSPMNGADPATYETMLTQYMDGFLNSMRDVSDVEDENFAGTPAKTATFKMDVGDTPYYGKIYALYVNDSIIGISYLSLSSSMADFVEIRKTIQVNNTALDAAIESEKAKAATTIGEQNALSTAMDYLDYSGFSYSGLIDQLEFEGYTTEEATYAADNCGADWNEQAARMAQDYLNSSSFSRQGLIDQLVFEGFTQEQAEHGVSAVGY